MSNNFEVWKNKIEAKLEHIRKVSTQTSGTAWREELKLLTEEVLDLLTESGFVQEVSEDIDGIKTDLISIPSIGVKLRDEQYRLRLDRVIKKHISEADGKKSFTDRLTEYFSRSYLIDEWAFEWYQKNVQRKQLVNNGGEPEKLKQLDREMGDLRNRIWLKLNETLLPVFLNKASSKLKEEDINDKLVDVLTGSVLKPDSKAAYDHSKSDSLYGYVYYKMSLEIKSLYLPYEDEDLQQDVDPSKGQAKKKSKKKRKIDSLDRLTGKKWDKSLYEYIEDDSVKVEDEAVNKVGLYQTFPRLITELSKALTKHKKKDIFYTLFTFNTVDETEAEKNMIENMITDVYIENNDLVFPMMVLGLIVFLKAGKEDDYVDMLTLISKDLKRGINLNQRQCLLGKYINVSRQTIGKYDEEYRKLRKLLI